MPEYKTIQRDHTFEPESLYGSRRWCAITLGKNYDWLRQNIKKLEGDGFPPTDPLTGLRIKADVIAWVNKRRRVSDSIIAAKPSYKKKGNLSGL